MDKYKWDLTKIFKSDKEFNDTIEEDNHALSYDEVKERIENKNKDEEE